MLSKSICSAAKQIDLFSCWANQFYQQLQKLSCSSVEVWIKMICSAAEQINLLSSLASWFAQLLCKSILSAAAKINLLICWANHTNFKMYNCIWPYHIENTSSCQQHLAVWVPKMLVPPINNSELYGIYNAQLT